jgi:hypothetical protein
VRVGDPSSFWLCCCWGSRGFCACCFDLCTSTLPFAFQATRRATPGSFADERVFGYKASTTVVVILRGFRALHAVRNLRMCSNAYRELGCFLREEICRLVGRG